MKGMSSQSWIIALIVPKRSSRAPPDTIGKIGIDSVYRSNEDVNEEILPHDRIGGLRFGGSYVPVEKHDTDEFKMDVLKGISVLGYYPESSVPRQVILEGDTDVVVAPYSAKVPAPH